MGSRAAVGRVQSLRLPRLTAHSCASGVSPLLCSRSLTVPVTSQTGGGGRLAGREGTKCPGAPEASLPLALESGSAESYPEMLPISLLPPGRSSEMLCLDLLASGDTVQPHSACHFWKAPSCVVHSLAYYLTASTHYGEHGGRFHIIAGFSALRLWSNCSKMANMKTLCSELHQRLPGPRGPSADSECGLTAISYSWPPSTTWLESRGGFSLVPPSPRLGVCRKLVLGQVWCRGPFSVPCTCFCHSPRTWALPSQISLVVTAL